MAVLVLRADEQTFAALTRALGETRIVRASSTEDALVTLAEAGVDVAVVGPGTPDPIGFAQRAHAASRETSVIIVAEDGRREELAATIRLTPLLGEDVRCIATADGIEAIAAEAKGALERVAQRRRHRATLAALAEQLLPQQEPLHRPTAHYLGELLDHAPIGVVTLDREARILAWNCRATEILGAPEREVVGTTLHGLFPDGTVGVVVEKSLVGGDAAPEVIERSGRPGARFVEVSAFALPDGGGPASVVLLQDVSARVLAERARAQAEEEARSRARRQQALASLGARALAGLEVAEIVGEAAAMAARELGTDYASVLELEPDGTVFRFAAGFGWAEESLTMTIPAGNRSLAGYAVASHTPVVVSDLEHETRFEVHPVLREAGVRSALSVVIEGRDRPFGALNVLSTAPRSFTAEDADFLQSVANLAGTALERGRTELALRESEERVRLALDAGRMGTWLRDLRSGTVRMSSRLEEIHGIAPSTFEGTLEAYMRLVHPDDHAGIYEAASRALAGADYDVEYRIVRSDGSTRWIEGKGRVLRDARGRPERMVGVGTDITDRKESEHERELLLRRQQAAREEAERATERLHKLQRVTASLAEALTSEQIADVVVTQGAAALEAFAGAVAVLSNEGDVVDVLAGVGDSRALIEQWRRFPVGAPAPLVEAVRGGSVMVVDSPEERLDGPADDGLPSRAWVAIPLTFEGRIDGGVALGFAREVPFVDDDREFVLTLGRQCTQALERARLYENEQAARRTAEQQAEITARLQAVTAALAEALTPAQVAEAVVTNIVAVTGATSGVVSVVTGETLRLVHATGYRNEVLDRFRDFPLDAPYPLAEAARTRQLIVLESAQERDVRYPALAGRTPTEGFVAVPLIMEGRCLGAMGLGFAGPRTFDDETRELMLALARQCAQALERARLYESERRARTDAESTGALLDTLIGSAPIGIAFHDPELRYVRINDTLADINGLPVEAHLGRTMAEVIPELAPVIEPLIRGVLETGVPVVDYEISGRTPASRETLRYWLASYYPVRGEGDGPAGVGVIVVEITERKQAEQERLALLASERRARAEAETAQGRLEFLAEATALLASSLDYRDSMKRLAGLAVPSLADWCIVYTLEEDGEIRRLAMEHADPQHAALAERIGRFRLDAHADGGVAEVLRTGRPALHPDASAALLAADVHDGEELLPLIEPLGVRSWMCAPLLARGRTLGAISFISAGSGRRYERHELELAEELARRAALLVDNARLFERETRARAEAEEAQRKLGFLAAASETLASSLDYEETLAKLARLAVPYVADWCAIDVLDEGGRIRRLAIEHVDRSLVEWARQMFERYPPDPAAPNGAPSVIRTGVSELYPVIEQDLLRRVARDADHLRMLGELGMTSAMVVPLQSRGVTFGAMTLVSTREGRRFDDNDLGFAEELARRAGGAMENTRLFREAQQAEERHRELVETVDAIVWEADPRTGQFAFVSKRAEAILGHPLDVWLQEGALERLVHPADRDQVLAVWRGAAAMQTDEEVEFRAVAADDRVVWLRAVIAVVHDEEGRAERLRGLMLDVSARRRAQRLQEVQFAVARVLAEAPTAAAAAPQLIEAICRTLDWQAGELWLADRASDSLMRAAFWEAAEAGAELLAATPPPLEAGRGIPGHIMSTGRPFWTRAAPDDERYPRAALAARAGLGNCFGIPVDASGERLGVLMLFASDLREPDQDLADAATAVGAQFGQFLERREAEEALAESEARKTAILEAALDAVVTIDAKARVLEFNPAAERMFGYERDAVLGRRIGDLIVPESLRGRHHDAVASYRPDRASEVVGRRVEMPAVRADGTELLVELAVTAVDVPGEPVFTAYLRDITARKTSEFRTEAQHATVRVLAEALTLDEAAPQILEAIARPLAWHIGALWTVDEDQGVLRCVYVWSVPEPGLAEFAEQSRRSTFRPGIGLPGRVWATVRPAWISDVTADDNFPRSSVAKRAGLHGAFAFPITSRGRVLGVVEFFSSRIREPDGELLRMVSSIGSQIGQFIDRRRAEEEARYQRTVLASQSEATMDGILVVSRDGSMASWNRRFLEMWEIPPAVAESRSDEAALRSVLDKLVDPDEFLRKVEYLYAHPDESSRDEILLKDGRVFDRWSPPLVGEDGTVYGRAWYFRDITDDKRTEAALRESKERAAFLSEASAILASSLDYRTTLSSLARLAVPYIADWCMIDLAEDDGSINRVALALDDPHTTDLPRQIHARAQDLLDPSAGRGVASVLRSGRSEISADVAASARSDASGRTDYLESLSALGARSYICVPMPARGRTLGAITFVSARSGRRYGPAELALSEELARRAGLAVDNARLYHERSYVARTLQESLLPPSLPGIPGIELAARYRAAGEGNQVGGDFYDVFHTGGRTWAAVVGDVCGKGADAAAVTALARYTVRAAAMQARKPKKVLSILNDALLQQRSDRRFCTVAYVRLETAEARTRATLSCGGHPPPFVLLSSGEVSAVGRPGTLLGVFPDPELADQTVELRPGDALIMYTDGITEARGTAGEFGDERLMRLIESCAGMDASAIAERLESTILDFQGGDPRDDIALLVLRIQP